MYALTADWGDKEFPTWSLYLISVNLQVSYTFRKEKEWELRILKLPVEKWALKYLPTSTHCMGKVILGSLLFYTFRATRNVTFHLIILLNAVVVLFSSMLFIVKDQIGILSTWRGSMIQYFMNNRRETSLMSNCCTSLLDFGGLIFYLADTYELLGTCKLVLKKRFLCMAAVCFSLGVSSGPSSGCKKKPSLEIQIISVGRTKDLSFSKYRYVCLVYRKRTSFGIHHGWNLPSRLPS